MARRASTQGVPPPEAGSASDHEEFASSVEDDQFEPKTFEVEGKGTALDIDTTNSEEIDGSIPCFL